MLTCMRYMLNPIQGGGEGAESDRTRTSSNVKNFFNIEADMPLNFGTFHGNHIYYIGFHYFERIFFSLLLKKSRNPRRRTKMAAVQK